MTSSRTKLAACAAGLVALAAAGLALFRPGAGPAAGRAPRAPDAAPPPAARAPAPPPAPASDDRELSRIGGTVTDRLTGAPIPGADVLLASDAGEITARTGDRGRFRTELAPGDYRLRAVGEEVASFGATRVAVAAGAEVDGVVVRAARLARVRGRVVDAGGAPVEGAVVTHRAEVPGTGIRIDSEAIAPAGAATTGEGGRFALQVAPGRVTLAANARGRPPGHTEIRWAAPAADLAGVEVVLPAGASIRGRVLGPDGEPAGEAKVAVTMTASGASRTARAGADGAFALADLPAGDLQVSADADGFAPSIAKAVTLGEGAAHQGLRLRLRTARALEGRVVGPDGAGVNGARVVLRRAGRAAPVARAIAGDSGAFAIPEVGGGPFAAVASADGFARARVDEVRAPAAEIVLVLERAGAIAGRVTDSRGPVRDLAIRLRPRGAAAARREIDRTWRFVTETGRYRVDGLDPGVYDVIVTSPGYAQVEIGGVRVVPGSSADGSVVLGPGGTVAGTVTDAATGAPIAGALVTLSGHALALGYTGADGGYAVSGAAPGRRSVAVRHPGYVGRIESAVEIVGGEEASVDVALEPLASGSRGELEFSGIGAVLELEGDRLVIERVVPEGPAARAKLRGGDAIVAVDERAVAGRGFADLVEAIRGVVGSTVRLAVEREDEPRFVLDVVRDKVRFEKTSSEDG